MDLNSFGILFITGVLIRPQPDQEGNKLQRQKILSFIYPIYNHNWRNISTIYITRLASNEIFSPSNKIYREVGRAKDLSAPLYIPHPVIRPSFLSHVQIVCISVCNNSGTAERIVHGTFVLGALTKICPHISLLGKMGYCQVLSMKTYLPSCSHLENN